MSLEGKKIRCLQSERSSELDLFLLGLRRYADAEPGEPILPSQLTEDGSAEGKPSPKLIYETLQQSEIVLVKLSADNFFALRLCEVRHLFRMPVSILVQSFSSYFDKHAATPFFQGCLKAAASFEQMIGETTSQVLLNATRYLSPNEVESAIEHYLEHASCFRWGQMNMRHGPPNRYSLEQYRSGVYPKQMQRIYFEYQNAKHDRRPMRLVSNDEDSPYEVSAALNSAPGQKGDGPSLLLGELTRLIEHLTASDADGKTESICFLAAAAEAISARQENVAKAHLASIRGSIKQADGQRLEARDWVLGNASRLNASTVVSVMKSINAASEFPFAEPATILFMGANPSNETQLALTAEFQQIDNHLRASELRKNFRIEQQWEMQARQLPGKIMRFKPQVLHFSGHGSKNGELVFLDDLGFAVTADPEAIARVFRILSGDVKCVVLNACYSSSQAKAISQHVETVIGMSSAIGDADAIAFACSFYEALGYGKSIADAFELAKVGIVLSQLDDADLPQLYSRPGVDPSATYIVRRGN